MKGINRQIFLLGGWLCVALLSIGTLSAQINPPAGPLAGDNIPGTCDALIDLSSTRSALLAPDPAASTEIVQNFTMRGTFFGSVPTGVAPATPGTPVNVEFCVVDQAGWDSSAGLFNEDIIVSAEGGQPGTCPAANPSINFTRGRIVGPTTDCTPSVDCISYTLDADGFNSATADGDYDFLITDAFGHNPNLCAPGVDMRVTISLAAGLCANGYTVCIPQGDGTVIDTCATMVMVPVGDTVDLVLKGYDAQNCEVFDTIVQAIGTDVEGPAFQNCPPDDIVLQAGPGECEVVWIHPKLVAIDNCPTGSDFEPAPTTAIEDAAIFAAYGGGTLEGIMHDISNPGTAPIRMTGYGINFGPAGNYPMPAQFYYRPGTWVGFDANAAGWTLVVDTIVPAANPNFVFDIAALTSVDSSFMCGEVMYDTLPGGIVLQPGDVIGVYANSPGNSFSMLYEATSGFFGTTPNQFATDGCAQLEYNGDLINGVFGGRFNSGLFPSFIGQNSEVIYDKQLGNEAEICLTTGDSTLGPGCLIPIGTHCFVYEAKDAAGNTSSCDFCIIVNEWPNTITALACNDNIQLSLDETCMATVTADMVLEGGPYGCYDDYIVIVEDDRGNLVDFDNDTSNGTQLGWTHIKKCYTVTVIDPETGNSCWGEICVEDKLPPTIVGCDNDTVECTALTDPGFVATPIGIDACDPFVSMTYVDWVTKGSCAQGFERIISRRWTATDDCGNSTTCEQIIYVELATLFDVILPPNYDDLGAPALECDQKIDENKIPDDLSNWIHVLDFPFCVDGYLLDSANWFATGGNLNLPAGPARDLSGQRLPRALGWNCLDSGPYAGHPSPFPVYYDEHPQWQLFRACWGPDQVVAWVGTGFPTDVDCSNIVAEYRDTRINLSDPDCDAGDVGCYKVLRQWTLIDWCTGEVGGHNQIIKVLDQHGPEILAPDEIEVGTDPWYCLGRFDVPAPWITDNCSEDVEYSVTTKYGTVFGTSETGYVVADIPLGSWPLYIEAYDCCGNVTVDSIIMNVADNTPPVCISEDRVQLSLAGNQSPGSNYAAICAEDLNKASYDNCTQWLWYKMIRMDELLGTVNGSFADNTVACGGVNGDDDPLIQGNQVYYDDCAKFCCDDADQIIMVVLRVHDVDPGAGAVHPSAYTPPAGFLVNHFTDCWVEIDVRDKAQPIVVAPPDIVVSCMFWFDDSEDALEDVNNRTFGRVVTDLNDREKVKTIDIVCDAWCEDHPKYDYLPSRNRPVIAEQACAFYNQYWDPSHPDDKYELVWGFDGYVVRTCGATPTIRVDDQRECGQGLIARDVIVTYVDPKTGGAVTYRDRQEIWVIDCDPFYINNDNCFDTEDCIQWPLFCAQPQPLEGCGADLDPYTNPQLGYPVIENGCDDNCALVAVDYDDETFYIEDTACFKVIRTWTVIDWCTYDPFNFDPEEPVGRWEWVQVIVVRDKIDPVVTVDEGDCEPLTYVMDPDFGCVGHVDLCAEATDDCSPDTWLVYDYKIDAFSDGVGAFGDFDFYVGKLTRQQFDNGITLTCENDVAYDQACYYNPFADDPTQPFCASGTYPIGVHTIYWFVEDGCGNVVKETYEFEIKDCKEPTPYCKNGIITVVMPANGEICIWASDLDDGSFDNCTKQENLKFYFNGNPADSSLCFTCDDFEAAGANDKLIVDVEVWVEDEAGNTDFCKTTVEIQDNQDVCPDVGSLVRIGGDVINPTMTEPVEGVEMYLNGNMDDMTDNAGEYAFLDLPMNGDYAVAPSKNDDPLNGVTTADLIALRSHLLARNEFTSAFQVIAADANNSQTVSAADISAIRKLILGNVADFNDPIFDGQKSWRFVDQGHVFNDFNNPWGWPESIEYADLNQKMYDVDFHAVKIGDINGDAKNNSATGIKTRGNGKLTFTAADARLSAGDEYRLDITADNFKSIAGYQFTMQYDAAALEFAAIESGVLTVNESNIGLTRMDEGIMTMSWNADDAASYNNDEVLFTIVLDVTNNVQLSEAVSLNSLVTKAEAYNSELEAQGLELEFRNGSTTVEIFELYQNVPNPFKNGTVIGFNLPEEMTAVLTVYDVAGKVLKVTEIEGVKGYNEKSLTKADLNGAGVLYYQLDAADYTATKRMILID